MNKEYGNMEEDIRKTIQDLIDKYGLDYDTVNDFNHDYDFEYSED